MYKRQVEEVRGGKARYGIRYYKEKARGAEKMFAVRWLTATGAELARKAIHEIRALTQDARTRARDLEKTPHRVPIPGFHWAARMTTAEVTLALGTKEVPKPLPRHHDHEGDVYKRQGGKWGSAMRCPVLPCGRCEGARD